MQPKNVLFYASGHSVGNNASLMPCTNLLRVIAKYCQGKMDHMGLVHNLSFPFTVTESQNNLYEFD